jgi:hypothetical protein
VTVAPPVDRSGKRVWRPVDGGSWLCGQRHGRSVPGALDERARRLSHEELAVAQTLAREGHLVRSLAETRGQGPRADLEVCGRPVEVKSWLPAADRGGRLPTPQSVFNKLVRAARQAPAVVLYARGSGLSPTDARRGLALFQSTSSRLPSVRVLGDGFELALMSRPGLSLVGRGDHARSRLQSQAGLEPPGLRA